MKEKASIFIDASNVHYPLKREGWRISYRKLLDYFNDRYEIADCYYYEGIPSKSYLRKRYRTEDIKEVVKRVEAKKTFFKSLKELGMKVRTKPVQILYDHTAGDYKTKCNFDVELAIDAIDSMKRYKTFILFSGDGDFIKLLKYLKGHYKKTFVISAKGHSSDQLRETANQTEFLQSLRKVLEK